MIPSQIAFAGVRIPTLPFPSTAPPPTAANAILHIDLGAVTRDVNALDANVLVPVAICVRCVLVHRT